MYCKIVFPSVNLADSIVMRGTEGIMEIKWIRMFAVLMETKGRSFHDVQQAWSVWKLCADSCFPQHFHI